MNELGVNFAPTTENSLDGPHNGALTGIPAAIKILSLRLPRITGAAAPTPDALLNAAGAQGDPMHALMASLAQSLGLQPHAMGLPGGTAGPNQGTRTPPSPGPFGRMPTVDPLPETPGPLTAKPRVVFEDGGGNSPTRTPGSLFGYRGQRQV